MQIQKTNSKTSYLNELLDHDCSFAAKYNLSKKLLLIGVDEVGRGCLAGPVCTAAFACSLFHDQSQLLLQDIRRSKNVFELEDLDLDIDNYEELKHLSDLEFLQDSKQVPKNKRKALCKALLDIPIDDGYLLHSINFQEAQIIDEIGIVKAIWKSMSKNIIDIYNQYFIQFGDKPSKVIVLVDGPKAISNEFLEDSLNFEQICIVKGDSKSASIAAASNLAKEARDDLMQKLSKQYKKY
jgi:ribonuclease HII